MLKLAEISQPDSCIARALDFEMLFVLLGRDAAAPVAVRAWIAERLRIGANMPNDPQILEAEQAARIMENQRKDIRAILRKAS